MVTFTFRINELLLGLNPSNPNSDDKYTIIHRFSLLKQVQEHARLVDKLREKHKLENMSQNLKKYLRKLGLDKNEEEDPIL